MFNFLAISVGAVVGANARYLISRLTAKALGPMFPYGTLFINIGGSFVAGFFMIWTSERVIVDPRWRLLVVIGFCGGFTTFSSYAYETMAYFEQGQWRLCDQQRPGQQRAVSHGGHHGHEPCPRAVKCTVNGSSGYDLP